MSRSELLAVGFCLSAIVGMILYLDYWVHAPLPAPTGTTLRPIVNLQSGPLDIYPAADITGAINPAVTQSNISSTICVPGFTARPGYRPQSSFTTSMKRVQLAVLGLSGRNLADYEEDHLISLELGGNPTDPHNLWPEPYHASIPDGGARTKDQVENYLKREVCAGVMTLAEAQREIVSDWYAVYLQNLKGKAGALPVRDPDDE